MLPIISIYLIYNKSTPPPLKMVQAKTKSIALRQAKEQVVLTEYYWPYSILINLNEKDNHSSLSLYMYQNTAFQLAGF